MEILKELACNNGFDPSDYQLGEDLGDGMCFDFDCSITYLALLKQWFINEHSLYVSVNCFNRDCYGITIYQLDYTGSGGAPIVFQVDPIDPVQGCPSYSSDVSALSAGLLEAFQYLRSK